MVLKANRARLLLCERAPHHLVVLDNAVKERPSFAQFNNKIYSVAVLVRFEELHTGGIREKSVFDIVRSCHPKQETNRPMLRAAFPQSRKVFTFIIFGWFSAFSNSTSDLMSSHCSGDWIAVPMQNLNPQTKHDT